MARSLSGAAALAASLSDSITLFVNRRGYAAAAAAVGRPAEKKPVVRKVVDSSTAAASGSSNSWIPDPVTGYYRPTNFRVQDAAEQREMLLSYKQ
ncbi:late embryogenesis abundant protein Lea5-D-like [Musa acuminata AAA Group]|uniref:late embryogenesis abundant protein Lea5-D-like n=1 Tax=Musa acuminata AAA Group TaxID=214697 RepID=UPI0031DDD5AD